MSASDGPPADGVRQSLASGDNEGRQAPNVNDAVEGDGTAGDGLSIPTSETTHRLGYETRCLSIKERAVPGLGATMLG